MNPKSIQFEKYWREKIAEEVAELMRTTPSVNAYGVYLYIRDGNGNSKMD